ANVLPPGAAYRMKSEHDNKLLMDLRSKNRMVAHTPGWSKLDAENPGWMSQTGMPPDGLCFSVVRLHRKRPSEFPFITTPGPRSAGAASSLTQ
ncbi:hypothetical protein, partial [Aeromonas caviae]|uniref:hypothetical protein n=1 Tax=Aeromonas caviae TaxID=648 RepID=UPI00244D69EC